MRKKVLIVEDNTELLELLRLTVREAGFCVSTASNGVDALKKARTLGPDLMILDLVLPELDGFAVCEHLRRDPSLTDLPIIALTGLTSEISRLAGLESGATEYVTKPFTPGHLVSCIERLLQPRAEAAQVQNR